VPETCWADYKCKKAFSSIQLDFFSMLTPRRCLENGNIGLLAVIVRLNLAPNGCELKVHGPGDLFPQKELPVPPDK